MNRESDNGSREPDPDLLRGVDRQQTDPGASAVATSDEIRTNSHFEFPKTVHIYHHYEDSGDGKRTFEQAEKSNKSPASLPPSPVEHVVTAVRDLLKRVAVPIGRVSPGPSLSGAADSADDKDKCVDEKLSDSSPNNEDATTNGESWFDDSVPMPPPPRKLWHGMDGLAVMGLGVLAPILITGLTLLSCPKRITLLLINHPCETLLEMMMVAFIPFATYRVWRSCCNSDWRFKPTRGLLLGLGLCASLLSALVSFAALFGSCSELSLATGTDFTTGFFTIGMLALGSALSQIYVANVVRRNKDFKSSQIRVVIYVLAGLFLGAASFAASECRSWCVRIAEKSALSSRAADRSYGLFMLRELNTEKELRLETSDPRSVGLAGLFIPLKQSDVHKLYFTVTGLPFRSEADSDYSAMSDDYLARHVVGSPVKGLSLVRSAINGKVNANALSSTIGWTYVFHNDTIDSQEVRAEIALPPDAAISNLTVWQDGEPMEATFSASGKAVDSGGSMNVGHESPAIISDLGRGRYLFHCYPVREGGELKVQITAVLPLRLESLESAELNIPRFIACNFELEGEHTLHLESKGKLFSSLSNLKSTRGALGKEMLDGNLTASQIEHTPLLVTARRDSGARTVVATDRKGAEIALQDAKQEAARKRAELAELEREAGYD
ncbi:MAG: hypothetical protein K8F91_27525, partial [Candidatus Obscuribacterales bacterium]|nr:hypothetical protein [Candidatus Obscuribacterales bacterium]